jgi:hypothetical protein
MEKTPIDAIDALEGRSKFLFVPIYEGLLEGLSTISVCLVPGDVRGSGATREDAIGDALFREAEWCRILGVSRSEWYSRVRKDLDSDWQHIVTNEGEWL